MEQEYSAKVNTENINQNENNTKSESNIQSKSQVDEKNVSSISERKEVIESKETTVNQSSEDEDLLSDHVKTNEEDDKEDRQDENKIGSDEWFKEDQKKFASTFPDVDSEKLFSDPIFLEFAEKRAGVESMVDIYQTYLSVSRRIESKVMEKAENEFKIRLANAKATPGSLTESTKVSDRLYTFDELKKMSPETIERNWQKVQQSIKSFGK